MHASECFPADQINMWNFQVRRYKVRDIPYHEILPKILNQDMYGNVLGTQIL
jgi:hypothetical protein